MDPEDKEKTAFHTEDGLYQWKAMSMGLSNSSATFNRVLERILTGIPPELCVIYINDVLVHAPTIQEMFVRLREVLERIRNAGLKFKPSKCTLFQRKVAFLGHEVSAEGVQPDPEKTKAVKEWPRPACVKDVRAFLGLCGYYRRFVEKFADVAKPLYKLTEKENAFAWTEETEKAFLDLKERLCRAPVLAYPDVGRQFILDCDASNEGLGAVLSQCNDEGLEKPVAYYAHTFSKVERRYCVTRRELLACVGAIRHFNHYLLGASFTVRTDHSALTWLCHFKEVDGQLARWLETLAKYDFKIIHRKGVRHANADGLSRRPCIYKDCRHCDKAELLEYSVRFVGVAVEWMTYSDATQGTRHAREEGSSPLILGGATSRRDVEAARPPGDCTGSVQPEKIKSDNNGKEMRTNEHKLPREDENVEDDKYEACVREEIMTCGVIEPSLVARIQEESWLSCRGGCENDARELRPLGTREGEPMPWSETNSLAGELGSRKDIIDNQSKDPHISPIVKLLSHSQIKPEVCKIVCHGQETKRYWAQWESLKIMGGVLYRKFENIPGKSFLWQVIMPKNMRVDFLSQVHDHKTVGHLGMEKTRRRVMQRAYWFNWRDGVDQFCRECKLCASRKPPARRLKAPMQQHNTGVTMERVSMDILGPLPKSDSENKFILLVCDYFTKWVEAFPTPNQEARTVAERFVKEFVCRYGVPRRIFTDQGSNFQSELFKEVCELLDIDKDRTTPYHPQSDGFVERMNRTIEAMLSMFISPGQRDWDDYLPYIMMAYRSAVQDTTGYSPSMMMLGREVALPVDIVLGRPPGERDSQLSSDYVQDLNDKLEAVHQVARNKIKIRSDHQKKHYDLRVHGQKYDRGQFVWLHNPVRKVGISPKLVRSWEGPFLVVKRLSDVTYRIQLNAKSKMKVVHFDRLKPYVGSDKRSWLSLDKREEMIEEISSPLDMDVRDGELNQLDGQVLGNMEGSEDQDALGLPSGESEMGEAEGIQGRLLSNKDHENEYLISDETIVYDPYELPTNGNPDNEYSGPDETIIYDPHELQLSENTDNEYSIYDETILYDPRDIRCYDNEERAMSNETTSAYKDQNCNNYVIPKCPVGAPRDSESFSTVVSVIPKCPAEAPRDGGNFNTVVPGRKDRRGRTIKRPCRYDD